MVLRMFRFGRHGELRFPLRLQKNNQEEREKLIARRLLSLVRVKT
jgi:hypothetical protein